MVKYVKEKIIGAAGSISGFTSIMGSWQVCHSVCLGLIALLGVLGITAVGMPLLFLNKIAVPLWTTAFILLLIIIGFYLKKRCISPRLIMFNSGIIIAGIPFRDLQQFSIFFWVIGGITAFMGASLFIKDKITKKLCKHEN